MYHLRLKGGHYEMGVKRGKIFNRGKISFPLQLDDFQLEHGKQSEAVLKMFFPEVCEEIRGVSDTIGADYLNFASWMLCMGCCMYNLENNIPVEIRGCTAFAYEKEGRLIYGRNNDLPPYLRDGSKSEIYDPKNGNRFNITTSLRNCQLLLTATFYLQIKGEGWQRRNVRHLSKIFGKQKSLIMAGSFV